MGLACILFFAATGLTLNHAASIAGKSTTIRKTARLPRADLALLGGNAAAGATRALPPRIAADAGQALGMTAPAGPAEWSDETIDVDLARPGAEGTLSIDRASGALDYELTRHGWIAWANDLHKGRHAGAIWFWFIDLLAVAVLVFALTGLCLLQLHARHRPRTWPVVGFGLALPIVLLLLFVHS